MFSDWSKDTDSLIFTLKALLQILFTGFFFLSTSWRVFHVIQPSPDHLDLTLVDYLNPYLSTCLIRHLPWLSMSCGCQGNTIQGSSLHKCGQKSSCSAFNVVVAAFLQIFFQGFLLSCTFLGYVLVIDASWEITLIIRFGV